MNANEKESAKELPRSVVIAQEGVTTSGQFCSLMSALMSDLLLGKVTPQCGNAVVNAGGKLLKTVELEQKYGTESEGQPKSLRLAAPTMTGTGLIPAP